MHSTPIVGKSQELHFLYNEPRGDNTGIYDGDEDEIQMMQDPRLYQSQDFSGRKFEESEFIHYNEPTGDMENEPYREQFEDSSNFIDLNPSTVENEVEVEDFKKNYNENYHSQRNFDLDQPKYEHRLHDYQHSRPVVSHTNMQSNYDSNPKPQTGYGKSTSNYRKAYAGQDSENEDDLMDVESDNSDEHYSPQMYISKHRESSFAQKKQMKLRENTENAQLDLQHSSSSSRLRYIKAPEPRRMDYSKDKTRSSTSNIANSYLQRTKPTPKIELHMEERIEPLNKTSHDLSHRQKPISTTLSYQQRPVAQRGIVQRTVELKEETNIGRDNGTTKEEPDEKTPSSLGNRYRNLVGQSSYGKAMVASYNSYFKHEREHIRPTTAVYNKNTTNTNAK